MSEELKDMIVSILVTAEEKTWIEKQAEKEQRTISNWARIQILKEMKK